jgi:hypothetical protein
LGNQQIVIIGGGNSISEGVENKLWEKLKDKWTIGCNSAFKFIIPTILTFVDNRQFYQLFYNELKEIPLIIGKNYPALHATKYPNTFLLPVTRKFDYTLKSGVYSGQLCGIFALTIAQYLLRNTGGEIFLLGFDFCADGKVNEKDKTHFYQESDEIKHPGIGRASFYNRTNRFNVFEVYKDLAHVKIFNVSTISKIPYFDKLTYDTFFEKLNTSCNQQEIRDFTHKELEPYFV